jgi:hypothetical protein
MEFLSDARQDVYKPSIFELIAQEQLRDLLQPALKYVLGVSQFEICRAYSPILCPFRCLHNVTHDILSVYLTSMKNFTLFLCLSSRDTI